MHVDVRVLEGHVAPAARPEDRPARLHLGERADPVELGLEAPRGVVERLPAALGEHRLEPRGSGGRRAVFADARNASQSVLVFTKWNSRSG